MRAAASDGLLLDDAVEARVATSRWEELCLPPPSGRRSAMEESSAGQ
jgi:hypothetical protein